MSNRLQYTQSPLYSRKITIFNNLDRSKIVLSLTALNISSNNSGETASLVFRAVAKITTNGRLKSISITRRLSCSFCLILIARRSNYKSDSRDFPVISLDSFLSISANDSRDCLLLDNDQDYHTNICTKVEGRGREFAFFWQAIAHLVDYF